MSKKRWFKLMISGAGMIFISTIFGGGLIHTMIESPGSWLYMIGLSCGGASSLITGLLMLFDAARYKIEEDVFDIKGRSSKKEKVDKETSANVKQQMKSLVRDCERLRPESMKSGKA